MHPSAAAPASRVISRYFEYSLLGMLAAGYGAVVASGYLDWPTAVLALLSLLVRALVVAEVIAFELPPRVVAALAIGYMGFFPLDYYYFSGTFLAATVHMVFFLAALKLLTARTSRDYGYLKAIAGLELIAAAMLSSGFSFLVYLAIFVLFAIATFASGEVRRAAGAQAAVSPGVVSRGAVSRGGLRAFSRRLSVLSAILFVGILLLTAGLFLVLPRTAQAAFERFVPQRYRLTGFSNTVTLGEIGRIKQSSAPVMHVRSYQGEGFLPVKWRGAALAEFDGKRWFNPPGQEQTVRVEDGLVAVRTATEGASRGPNVIYQVHLEPLVSDTLFFAGTVETINIDVPFLRASRGGGFHVPARFGGRGLNYSAYGFLPNEWAPGRYTAQLPAFALRELVSLPPLDPRIPALALEMTRGADTPAGKARALETRLRGDYGYTLELLSQPVDDPLAFFLFERKKGHCEYFASSMAVMLRTLGIPSRVVTGFQSGVYNPMTGWQVVRASDAHSWVEAWIEGRGWTTFDPTPFDTSGGGMGWLTRLSLLSDTVSQFWQDWVMSYDLGHQVALASRMQSAGRRLRFPDLDELTAGLKRAARTSVRYAPAAAVLLGLAVVALLFGPPALKRWRLRAHTRRLARGETGRSDATILYQQMLELLDQRGFQKPPWLTPVEFARVLRAPNLAGPVAEATAAYNELRFGGRRDAATRMMHVLEQIRQL
jgi:transglutaminase-like putative cysteine protease